MATPLAQMTPGMEWIPVMLLCTVSGLVAGLLAILLRPFARVRAAGRGLGILALAIGIASPLFFLCVVGSEVFPIAYLIFASPAALGGVAILIYPRRRAEARGFPIVPANPGDPEAE